MALTSKLVLNIKSELSNAFDMVTTVASLAYEKAIELASGTGADQADRVFSDERTLAGSASEDLDLAGSLVDALGTTITFARIKAIYIENLATGANQVIVGAAASNAFTGPFGASTHTVAVRAGGLLAMICRDATGWAVTAGTGDLLKIANSTSGSIQYRIVIIGCSA
jgi:hypothetical protein